ncbi:MAG: hypothetical protein NTW96_01160 [Planctomycetia bacterium]|nr:hypothetical protein [Planctomycetia bacterium]
MDALVADLAVAKALEETPTLHGQRVVRLEGGRPDPRQIQDDLGSVQEVTQWYTSRLEAFIRQAPEQYWWLHRRWKDPRKNRRTNAV